MIFTIIRYNVKYFGDDQHLDAENLKSEAQDAAKDAVISAILSGTK